MRLKDYIIYPATSANSAALLAYLDTIPDDSPEFYEYQDFDDAIKSKDNALSYAIKIRDIALLTKLLQKGADVNFCDNESKFTLLHLASISEYSKYNQKKNEILNLLLDHNANVNAQTTFYITPLYYAIEWCSDEVVDKFIQKGAKINDVNDLGMSVLKRALVRGDDIIINKLINAGGSIHLKERHNSKTILENVTDTLFGYNLDKARHNNFKSLKNWGKFAFASARRVALFCSFKFIFSSVPFLNRIISLKILQDIASVMAASKIGNFLDNQNKLHINNKLATPLNLLLSNVRNIEADNQFIQNQINSKQPVSSFVEKEIKKHPFKTSTKADFFLATSAFKEYRQP
ncbi:MAG: ankyrin repeat domain-containing protein [Alphaproteobacteria bacterium]|nr:ankyrin repeat domain-containing protein [Alphaproteobacteria bacterium]OJV12094.1 MAG: hypothetical protein BGO27_05070 [Alphaproteobacteria bacterium 33-17]